MMAAGTSLYAAAESDYLHIHTQSGWEILSLDQVDRLTFSNGVMTASDKDANTLGTYRQADLQEMYIDETSGVESVMADAAEATLEFDAASRSLRVLADGQVDIYSVAGELLASVPEAKKGESIMLGSIRQGIVICKSGNHSIKAILK